MKKMRVPSRPAPSVEDARQKQVQQQYRFQPRVVEQHQQQQQQQKKKPPPRPPPPNLSKIRSTSSWDLLDIATTNKHQQQPPCLINWSPPMSPTAGGKRPFTPFVVVAGSGAASISSSFSSSTSSLASSKKSFEYDTAFNVSPWTNNAAQTTIAAHRGPTIIRPQTQAGKTKQQFLSVSRTASPLLSSSPPKLPPPPSPHKHLTAADDNEDDPAVAPFAIALYQYRTSHPDDLILEVNDIVYLTERINGEWYRGRVDVQEGMFPAAFVDVHVPLPNNSQISNLATVLYTYNPNREGYLNLVAGSRISVLYRVDADWCMGELNGKRGQFPINHVDKLPEGV